MSDSPDYKDRLQRGDWMVCDAELSKATRMVSELHYAGGGSNTSTALHGLYRKADYKLMGVAWWIPPTRTAARAWWTNPEEVLVLSRLVLDPEVPKNGATFLLSKSVKLIDSRWKCLITYADTWRGHTGHIYRAAGWEYLGLTKPERTYTVDGRMVARKAGPITRTHSEMLAIGAQMVGAFSKHRFRLIRNLQRCAPPLTQEHFPDFLEVSA